MTIDRAAAAERHRIRTRLTELTAALAEFRAAWADAAGDDVLRFEAMCVRMFTAFVSRDATGPGPDDPPFSNLDTGDAIPRPYPPFAAAVARETAALAHDAHHYYGPECTTALADAALQFVEREGFRTAPALRVLAGAGTVHLYDAICRVLIEKPDDTILVPDLGYGFFITQPGRAGGRVAPVRCDGRGAVAADVLACAVRFRNVQLWEDWRRDGGVLVDRGIDALTASGLVPTAPSAASVSALKALLTADPDAYASPGVAGALAAMAPVLDAPVRMQRAITMVRSPRVVGFLHIQPAVSGHIYDKTETAALADVLTRSRVAAIEDVAYHSVRCRLRDLPSLQGRVADAFTLLGLSKPMAIANFRLGLLFVGDGRYERSRRALESTTGYVSTLLQRALAASLAAEGYDDYIDELSWGPQGYEARERLMFRMLAGRQPGNGSDDEERLVAGLVAASAASAPELRGAVDAFLRQGLSRWLRPLCRPQSGFFMILSCEPLLRLAAFRRLGIRTSLDVFALLASLFNLRSIPEEAMGPDQAAGTRLRISFSPEPSVVADLFLRAFAGLHTVEDLSRDPA